MDRWLSRLLDPIPVNRTKSESSKRRERVRIEVSCWHSASFRCAAGKADLASHPPGRFMVWRP